MIMGYMRDHAIVVTGEHGDFIDRAHAKAIALGCCVSEITAPVINSARSFFVAPDGSKEGWTESDAGDDRRAALIEFMDSLRYSDRSSPLRWVEVQFGDDNGETRITRHSDEMSPREVDRWIPPGPS
jgi:hypothetical protein